MFPSPSSHVPPHSRNVMPQGAPKGMEMNQAVQQIHGLKIDDSPNSIAPGPNPSENANLAASSTNVTYSPQTRATYPYSPQGSGGSSSPAPNNVPSAKFHSSFVGPGANQNGSLNGSYANGNSDIMPNGNFPSAQNFNGNVPTNDAANQNMPSVPLGSPGYAGAPGPQVSYGHPEASSMQSPSHNVGASIRPPYSQAGTNSNAPLYSPGMLNGPPQRSPALVSYSQPISSSGQAQFNSSITNAGSAADRSVGQTSYSSPADSRTPVMHGSTNSNSGSSPYHSPTPPSSVPYRSPAPPYGSTPYSQPVQPSGPKPYNASGSPTGPTPYSLPSAASGPTPYSTHGSLPGQTSYSPSAAPSGLTPYTTHGPPLGQTPYSHPAAPPQPTPYNHPGAHSRPTPYSPSGSPPGPTPYIPLGPSSGPTPYGSQGAPPGPTPYSPQGAHPGPSPYSPPGAPTGPAPYSPPGAFPGPTPYASAGVPPGPSPYASPGASSGPTPYATAGAPPGSTPYASPTGAAGQGQYGQIGAPTAFGPHAPSPYQQQPRKLDLDQMPNTVLIREEDKKTRSGGYPTDAKSIPPPMVTTNFIAQDRGVCSPRFMRSSMYCLPNSPDVLKQTGVPFAIVLNPMASVCVKEVDPPLCLYREQGPLRCKRCKAYMCPFMTFGEGGKCFQCAFCKVVTEVPQDYFCYLDGIGQRTDKFHRAEMCLGSYEFIAIKDYCKNEEQPKPPAYIFMIEVSSSTLRNGMVNILCENMKSILAALQSEDNRKDSPKVGFVTYNNVLHFYNLKNGLSQPHIMVMPDVHDAFVPLMDGFLVSVKEAESLIDSLMAQIPSMYGNEPSGEVLFGPVVQAGLEALKNANCAGKLLIFHSTLPTCDAPGRLQKRDGQKLLGTDKQKTVLTPQNPLYNKLAEDCVAAGCCIDLFLFPNDYLDMASLSPLCRHTGGHMYKYLYFQSQIDGSRFLEDLERNVTTTTAFDAVLRIRTSAGISPIFYYGNFFMSNATDIEISALNCHKAVTVELAYDEKLAENDTVYIQAALLYTTSNGDRRIRVHNLMLSTSNDISDVYKGCEFDTIVHFLAKQGLKLVFDQAPLQIRNSLVSRAVKMLTGYRKHCPSNSSASSANQLILPETLRLLPLYVNCMLKSDAVTGGPELSLDDRSFAILALNGMDVQDTVYYFYPLLISLHDLDLNSEEMPIPIRCSMEKLSNDGAYLLTNGVYMFLWIGQGINSDWVHDVYSVSSPAAIDKHQTSLMELDTALSKRIRLIIEKLNENFKWCMRLNTVVAGDKLEIVFRQFLVEDRGANGSPSYVEFMVHLHQEISKLL